MYLPIAHPPEIVAAITQMDIQPGDVVAIMLGERNKPDLEQLVQMLNEARIEFFGGVFPGVIYGNQKYEEGAAIMVLPALAKPFLVKDLSMPQLEFSDVVSGDVAQNKKYTALIFVDGLSPNVAPFLVEMFNRLGDSVSYLGGGACSLSFVQQPCVFTSAGVVQNGAVVAFVKLISNLGVRHGWRRLTGPIVATKTRKNLVMELNWRNAFEVYREIVETEAGLKLTSENFNDVAKGYPFGIYVEGAEDLVRDAIAVTAAGELVFVIDIPENTVLNILNAQPLDLIQAAGQAAEDCQNPVNGKMRQSFVIDCISRVLYLEQHFNEELNVVAQKIRANCGSYVPEGILSLGEISSDGNGFLEYFNKTIVVGVLHE